MAPRRDHAMPPEVSAALGLHRAAESGALPLAVESTSVAEVNRWLRAEVPFFTDVPELAGGSLAVRGAAAVQLAGERAGYVLYQDHARPISLFVLPRRDWPPMGRAVRAGNVDFRWIETGDDRIVAWSHDPVSYLLVSDAGRAPSEACGVCHSNVGARGSVELPADALHGGKSS
jgi:anti-sigma factor RsiW